MEHLDQPADDAIVRIASLLVEQADESLSAKT